MKKNRGLKMKKMVDNMVNIGLVAFFSIPLVAWVSTATSMGGVA